MNNKDNATINKAIEAILFLRGNDGIEPNEVKELFKVSVPEARKLLKSFAKQYNANLDNALFVMEHVDLFKLATKPELYEVISEFVTINKRRRLSDSALETIAIIAYKQPIAKSEISKIRGVDSDGVIETLLAKNLVEEVDVDTTSPRRVVLYGTTKQFYDYFQISSLADLPEIEEFRERSEDETFNLLESIG